MSFAVAVVGNFEREWRTDSFMAAAVGRAGHRPLRLFDEPISWERLAHSPRYQPVTPDLVIWYRSRPTTPDDVVWRAIWSLRERGVPVIGLHPDLFWGLQREAKIGDRGDPFFHGCDVVGTSDGGHPERWVDAGVEHWWVRQAISGAEAERTPSPHMRSAAPPIVFVGNWRTYPHDEWPQRVELIKHLQRRWGHRLGLFPVSRSAQLRGQQLTDIVGHATVVIGDAVKLDDCGHYWSNRVPETLGRGGALLHRRIGGLQDEHPNVEMWDTHAELDDLIVWALDSPGDIVAKKTAGRVHTRDRHTYTRRFNELLERAITAGLIVSR